MSEQKTCPICGRFFAIGLDQCPFCSPSRIDQSRPDELSSAREIAESKPLGFDSKPEPSKTLWQNNQFQKRSKPALLSSIPRLGDLLIKGDLVSSEDIQRALALQEKRAAVGRSLLLGEALVEMGILDPKDLDRMLHLQSVYFHAALKEAERTLDLRVQERTRALDYRLSLMQTAASITRVLVLPFTLEELLQRAVDLIQQKFGFIRVCIFLPAEAGKVMVLKEVAGENADQLRQQGIRVEVGSSEVVGWVAANNQPSMVLMDGNNSSTLAYSIPGSLSEVAVPIAVNGQVLGVLDVQQSKYYAPDEDLIEALQMIADHIASAISHLHGIEMIRLGFREVSMLYKVGQQILQAVNPEQVLAALSQALTLSEFPSLMFIPSGQEMHLFSSSGLKKSIENEDLQKCFAWDVLFQFMVPGPASYAIEVGKSGTLPEELALFPQKMGWFGAVCFPVWCRSKLVALFILGSTYPGQISQTLVQAFEGLAGMASNVLEKLAELQTMQKRMDALQTLNTISQAVSFTTNLHELYQVIHHEVTRVIGEVDFLIAEFDATTHSIRIPYMVDDGKLMSFEPFPLGEGLVSILINSRQPLRLVENTEQRARELGAKIIGQPAKSWLGVPLIVANEVIGAMVVQDLEHEYRFDEDDQLLLSTLAAQVAVALRNARLLETMYQQAERERKLYEITSRIRSATDIQTILETTSSELRKALRARHARVELGVLNHPVSEMGEISSETDSEI